MRDAAEYPYPEDEITFRLSAALAWSRVHKYEGNPLGLRMDNVLRGLETIEGHLWLLADELGLEMPKGIILGSMLVPLARGE